MRLALVQHRQQPGRIDLRALQAGVGRHADAGAVEQRGDGAQIIQQHGQRQQNQVLLRINRRAGLTQAVGDLQHGFGRQADALGRAGGAGGKGDLGGAGRDAGAHRCPLPAQRSGGKALCQQLCAVVGHAQHGVDAGAAQQVFALLSGKERRNRHADQAGLENRQIPQQPLATVGQGQRHAAAADRAQVLGPALDLGRQIGVADAALLVAQRRFVGALGSVAFKAVPERLRRNHGQSPGRFAGNRVDSACARTGRGDAAG